MSEFLTRYALRRGDGAWLALKVDRQGEVERVTPVADEAEATLFLKRHQATGMLTQLDCMWEVPRGQAEEVAVELKARMDVSPDELRLLLDAMRDAPESDPEAPVIPALTERLARALHAVPEGGTLKAAFSRADLVQMCWAFGEPKEGELPDSPRAALNLRIEQEFESLMHEGYHQMEGAGAEAELAFRREQETADSYARHGYVGDPADGGWRKVL